MGLLNTLFPGVTGGSPNGNSQLDHGQTVLDVINEEAGVVGIPDWIPATIAYHESSLNPNVDIVDTNGLHSTGLFQLNQGGLGSGHSPQSLKNPFTNAKIAIPAMLPAYKAARAQGLTGVDLLNYVANNSGWPGSMGVSWTENHTNYDQVMDKQYNNWTVKTYKTPADAPSEPGLIKNLQNADVQSGSGNWGQGFLSLFGVKSAWDIVIVFAGIILCLLLIYRLVTK